jgi:hypothetical protein
MESFGLVMIRFHSSVWSGRKDGMEWFRFVFCWDKKRWNGIG